MSSSLGPYIDAANTANDVELASAISALRANANGGGGKLTTFFKDQQSKIYKDIFKQKDGTFQKVYGDLGRASQAQEAVLRYNRRTQEYADMQKQVYDNQKSSADAVMHDTSMAGRKHEMNEWTANNKGDTLFVFSSLFIMLAGLLLITVLWKMGTISAALWVAMAFPIILVFVLIVVRRSQYTDVLRNKRFWNKQIFEGQGKKIPTPSCPNLADLQAEADALKESAASGAKTVTGAVADVLAGAGNVATAASATLR
jgi:hypothetical protein